MNLYNLHSDNRELTGYKHSNFIAGKLIADKIANNNFDGLEDDVYKNYKMFGRNEDIEGAILNLGVSGAMIMTWYAWEVLGNRWEEAEEYIEMDEEQWKYYKNDYEIED